MSEHDGLEEMADVLDRNVACLSDDRAHEADKRAVLNIMSWQGITAEQARKLKKGCVGYALASLDELLRALEWQVSAEQETETKRAMAYQDLVRLAKERGRDALRALGGDHD